MQTKFVCFPSRVARRATRTLAVAAACAASLSAQALTIVATYDGTVSAQAQTAFNAVIAEFQAAFSDVVTVRVNVRFGNTGLGASSTSLQFVAPSTYAQVRSALIADETAHSSVAGAASIGAGGSVNQLNDPFGGQQQYLYTFAQAKALGARPANDAASDGTITFSSAQPFSFVNRGGPGFDFMGVAEHELSEVMGRITLNGNCCGVPNAVDPYDLFNFDGVGGHTLGTGAGRYFSIDDGTTDLHGYNDAIANPNSDSQDWDASDATDPFNAFTGQNQAHALNLVDLQTLDVIGWDLVGQSNPAPEPASVTLVLAGLFAVSAIRRRRSRSGA
jgi:hypothetical protein